MAMTGGTAYLVKSEYTNGGSTTGRSTCISM